MNATQHKLTILLVAIFGVVFLGASSAAERPEEPKWVSIGGTFINLNEVAKIEVNGEKLTFIAPTRKVVYQWTPVRKEVMARLRTLLKNSPNWVEVSKARNENQEWYANLARVPVIFYGTAPGNTQTAGLFWSGFDLSDDTAFLGIISNNDAANKLLRYISHGGYNMDRDADSK